MTIDFERIKRAIARVEAHGDAIDKTGTAFYIGAKFVLTALHVVADTRSGSPEFVSTISLQFSEADGSIAATVVDDLWSMDGDWAVLVCETQPDVYPIELDPEPARDMAWSSYGFPDIGPTGMTIKGEIRDPNLRPLASFAGLPRHPTLQLYCMEAAAGTGARMHGFSGAPCLVDGKAVGILRSTLIEEMVDGQSRQLLFTQAGTMYATPVRSILELQIAHREATLPGNWAPPEILLRDFIVLLSQREPNPTGAADAPRQVTLRGVATEAHRNLAQRGLSKPYFLVAADAVATAESLQECVRVLCTAKVVVFDATDFEPAIMFLVGIRAVVRRGVTLLSVGGGYALGKHIAIPFNVTDANVVAHSLEQNQSTIANSVNLLTDRIERALDAMSSPQYLDLPVYDAIRRLPTERRGIIPVEEGVLILCSFDEPHGSFWEQNTKQALAGELAKLRRERKLTVPASFGVSRSFELNSPRLVTHAVYEAIRRVQACVIDLSGWSANVLFELGVRVAASGERTVCLIDQNWTKGVQSTWLPQCRSLESHFVADGFKYNQALSWEGQAAFHNAYGPNALPIGSALLNGGLHRLIEQALDMDSEPASRSVVADLLDQAATFSRDPGSAGRGKPVGLFPGNLEMVGREEVAEFERLLAAWFYVSNRYATTEILADTAIRDAVYDVIEQLFGRHMARLPDAVQAAAGEIMDTIDEWREQHGQSPIG